jgi:two-component system, sensor histidine kinase and response regulator
VKGTILVVDDELGIRRGCQRVLEPEGFAVETAVSLEEARQRIESHSFDIILLDVMLPDGRGMDLLDPIQARDPETVIIIITGFATVELAVEAIKGGAYNFIAKPFTTDQLLMTVNQGLERRQLTLEAQRLQAVEQKAQTLAQAKEDLERLSEFKSRFTFIVAHELRSPVGGAQSLLRALTHSKAEALTDKQREILQRVELRLNQLMALINDLLDLAASKTMSTEEPLAAIAVEQALQESVDRFAAEAEHKQVALGYSAPDGEIVVLATEHGLARIFDNLISNAIKYTPEGGEVQVNLEDAPPGSVSISVCDTGMGIPAAALPHIGEEFFRAENARNSANIGSGLGLSIVKEMVVSLGGSLEIDSVEGKGSTFRVSLPKLAADDGR